MIVFLIDVASYQILQVVTISNETVYVRVWKDTLTNRLFYEKLFERIRDRENVGSEFDPAPSAGLGDGPGAGPRSVFWGHHLTGLTAG